MYHIKNIHIQNFRSIEYENIKFWKTKTVFVWKNDSWKTVILKALEKLLNSKKIKEKDFKDKKKKLVLSVKIENEWKIIFVELEAKIEHKHIKIKTNLEEKEIKNFLKKVNIIYIPSDRKINKDNKENGYLKLIDLILNSKEESDDKSIFNRAKDKLDLVNSKPARKKTTLLISLLKLYMYSLRNTKNTDFNIFIIDQPENFLHPHATKMIDEILQKIWELENSQVFYSTHSTSLVSNFRKWKYEIDDIVFVKNENGTTKAHKIDNSLWRFNKIMINLIFKNAHMFFSDAVILVEWETEKISIPNIYENTDLSKYTDLDRKNLTPEEKENYFNLNYRNISIVDVWGKWALYDWFIFASELFWKENVVAIIDRDENFRVDKEMIIKSIRQVYKDWPVYENDFKKYNWIVLDWEFENYYDVNVIRWFLADTIKERALRFWDKFDKSKFNSSLDRLDSKLNNLKYAKKISVVYERIFNSYFRKYSKPTIAFNLSIWLCQNGWYKENLLKIFAKAIERFDKD